MMIRLPIFVLFLMATFSSYGQQTATLDRIQLHSGKEILGIITEYKVGDYVVIRKVENNRSSRYPLDAVASIIQTEGEVTEGIELPYLIRPAVNSQLELKNGTSYQGQILAYVPGEELRIKLEDGTTLNFSETEIARISYDLTDENGNHVSEEAIEATMEQGKTPLPARPKPVYEFRERGFFNVTSFSFSFGAREQNNDLVDPFFPIDNNTTRSAIGFNVQHIFGYQFKRMAGLGLGASYDAYDLEDGEAILSLFAHYRGYLMQKNVSPFIALSGGYGFALRNENQGVTEADGGWMVHPEIGLRLGAAARANFTFSLGYRMQAAYYVQEFPFNGNIEYRNLVYRRMLFSLGLVF